MDHTTFTSQSSASVEVTFDGSGWTVRVEEAGQVNLMSFAFQQHAEAFAEGQRQRLGLPVDGKNVRAVL